jgi:hypothetical protein
MKKNMFNKNRSRSFFVCAVLFTFICVSMFPSVLSTPNQKASEGDIPTWYQGDEWTYTIDPLYYSSPNGSFSGSIENMKQKVVGITDDMYEIEITGEISGELSMNEFTGDCNGDITGISYVRVSDLAESSTELHSEGTITVLFIPIPYELDLTTSSSPLLELYDFPLNVGEEWQILGVTTTTGAFTIEGLYEQSLNGSQYVDETVQCAQMEQMTVPAGSYECYKLTREDTMVWYSADVGNTVKSTIDQSDETMTLQVTITLESFSHATQPITVTENISPAAVVPGSSVVISGQALATSSGDPIQNSDVSIEIPSTGDSWSTTTDSEGYYSKTIIAPLILDDTPCEGETGSGGVIVRCVDDTLVGYRVQTLTTLPNMPPDTPSITGETEGKVGVSYTYTIVTTDPEMNMVRYFVDWGDLTNSSIGPYTSGESVTVNHTFTGKGTYTIRVQAQDSYDAESGWGSLQVTMPKSFSYPFLLRFLERFPLLFRLLQNLLGQ